MRLTIFLLISLFLPRHVFCKAPEVVSVSNEVGKDYGQARKVLMEHGSRPVDQTNNPDRFCLGNQRICDLYPETLDCAGDVPECLLTWRSRDGKTFTVQGHVGKKGKMSVLDIHDD